VNQAFTLALLAALPAGCVLREPAPAAPRARESVIDGGLADGGEASDGGVEPEVSVPSPWRLIEPQAGPRPPPLLHASVVYDSRRDRLIVLGGHDTGTYPPAFSSEVWELPLSEGASWQRITTTQQQSVPGPRAGAEAVYDAARDRVWWLGGEANTVHSHEPVSEWFRDLWALQFVAGGGAAWVPPEDLSQRQLSFAHHHAALIIDSLDRLLFFGGLVASEFVPPPFYVSSAIRVHSTTVREPQWRGLSGDVPGPARMAAAYGYDAQADRLIVFGGVESTDWAPVDDAWAYHVDRTTWVRLEPACDVGGCPSARWYAASAFDGAGRRLWVHGGWDGSQSPLSDTWSLELGDSPDRPKWRRFPDGLARVGHAVVFVPARRELVVFGGLARSPHNATAVLGLE
jgi:hypothetical protein